MKKLLIQTILLAFPLLTLTQPLAEIDSLSQSIDKKHDANNLVTYNRLAFLYRQIKPSLSISYAQQALAIAQKNKDIKNVAVAWDYLGMGYRYAGQYDSALIFHQKALHLADSIQNDSLVATVNNRIALVYKKKGDYITAIKYLKESLSQRKRLGNKDKVADELNNIGNVFMTWGDYNKALEYFVKTLEIRQQTKNPEGLCYIYNNLGNLFTKMTNYQEAVSYHNKSLHIKDSLNDDYGRASSYHNIGNVYDKMGQYDKAIRLYEQALELFKKVGDQSGCANLLNDMGKNRMETGNLDKAEQNFAEALQALQSLGEKQGIATTYFNLAKVNFKNNRMLASAAYLDSSFHLVIQLDDLATLRDIYYYRAEINMKKGRFKQAFEMLKKYSEINDTLEEKRQKEYSQNATLLHAYNDKESENELLKKELELKITAERNQAQIRKLLILFIGIISILLVLLIYKYLKRKTLTRLLEEKAAELNEQKNLSLFTLAKLKANEQQLKAVFDNSQVGICTISREGEINMTNTRLSELLGIDEASPGNIFTYFNEADSRTIQKAVEDIFNKSKTAFNDEFWIKTIEGKKLRVRLHTGAILNAEDEIDKVICNISDINESYQAKTELQKQLNFLQTLIETIPSPVFYKDMKGKFIGCNTELLNFIGKKREEVIGKTVFDITSQDLALEYELKDNELLESKGKQIYEGKVKHKYGTLKDVIFYKSCLMEKGEIAGIVGIIVDITERKKFELKNKKDKDKAEAATGLKSMFLANMSHEIRTPMNGIVGMIDFLKGTELSNEQQEYLDIISVSSQNLLSIIDEILDFSKIESGQLEMEAIDFNPHKEVDEVVKLMSLKAKQKELKLTTEITSGLPDMVVGDPLRLKQVILNLVNNAIKFTSSGFVKVSCELVKTTARSNILRFEVKDNGIGLDKEQVTKLFKPYAQSEKSTARKYGGSGLGLIICKNLVELMNGKIGVESEKGKGSTFWFTIPFKKSLILPPDTGKKESEKKDIVIIKSDKVLNILVAEDDFMNQRFLTILLNKMGHKYDIAEDGLIAIDKFGQGGFDVILMDIDMPEMDGITATRKIRMMEKEKNVSNGIKIIAVTAKVIQGDRERCLEAGMNNYISKPFKSNDLNRVMQEIGLFDD